MSWSGWAIVPPPMEPVDRLKRNARGFKSVDEPLSSIPSLPCRPRGEHGGPCASLDRRSGAAMLTAVDPQARLLRAIERLVEPDERPHPFGRFGLRSLAAQ